MRKGVEYTHYSWKFEKSTLEEVKRTVLDYNLMSINDFINDCIRFAIDHMRVE